MKRAVSQTALAIVACTGAASAQTGAPLRQQQAILGTAPSVDLAGARILTWSSPAPDAINMHVVRASDGLVLFDALRRADQVDEAARLVESLGAPVRAIVLTHAHTDHYGGLPFWRQRFPGVPVYASAEVRDEMRDDVVPDNARRRAQLGSRFPTQQMINAHLPNRLVRDGETFTVAGLRVEPLVMGPSESKAAVVYRLPDLDAVIAGDLVNVLTISAPTLSLSEWLRQLDRIEASTRAQTALHVGHGPSGPAHALIQDQRRYLQLLDRLVREATADGQGVSGEETDEIVWKMRTTYPHHSGAAFLPPEALQGKRRVGGAAGGRVGLIQS